jgi:hypothetical protein
MWRVCTAALLTGLALLGAGCAWMAYEKWNTHESLVSSRASMEALAGSSPAMPTRCPPWRS